MKREREPSRISYRMVTRQQQKATEKCCKIIHQCDTQGQIP